MFISTKHGYTIYFSLIVFLYFSYFLLFMGLSFIKIEYLQKILIALHTGLCGFLLFRFNSFYSDENLTINKYEKRFIFSCAVMLLLNVVVYEIGVEIQPAEFLKKTFAL